MPDLIGKCPQCSMPLKMSDPSFIGQMVRCPKCTSVFPFTVDQPEPAPAPAAEKKVEPEPSAKTKPKPEPKPEKKREPKPEPKPSSKQAAKKKPEKAEKPEAKSSPKKRASKPDADLDKKKPAKDKGGDELFEKFVPDEEEPVDTGELDFLEEDSKKGTAALDHQAHQTAEAGGKKMMVVLFAAAVIAVGLFVAFVVMGWLKEDPIRRKGVDIAKPLPSVTLPAPAFRLTAAELTAEFGKDADAAVKKYTDKVVEVTGVMIALDESDEDGHLRLQGSDQFDSVLCGFAVPGIWQYATPGQTVTVRGKYYGGYNDATLANCELVKVTGDRAPLIKVSELANELASNQQGAVAKYNGKWFFLVGKVKKVQRSTRRKRLEVVTFETGKDFTIDGLVTGTKQDHSEAVAGTEVTILGKGEPVVGESRQFGLTNILVVKTGQ